MKIQTIATLLVCGLALGGCSSSGEGPSGSDEDTTANSTPDAVADTQSTPPDSTATVDSTPPEDDVPATPNDAWTGDEPDTTAQADAEPMDTAEPMGFDPDGSWLLVATPSIKNFCGLDHEFADQTLVLTVADDGTATATLEPPEWFLTLEFTGTLAGAQLTMQAVHVEEAPFSLGSAITNTHTIDVTFTSETDFEGPYVHEWVPNSGDPCTYDWVITGTKQP